MYQSELKAESNMSGGNSESKISEGDILLNDKIAAPNVPPYLANSPIITPISVIVGVYGI